MKIQPINNEDLLADHSEFLEPTGDVEKTSLAQDSYVGGVATFFLLPIILSGCQILGVIDQDLDEDNDGFDGIEGAGTDCDDHDAAMNPGVNEIPADGIDQNCNGDDDEDADADGLTIDGGDCDDGDPSIRTGYFEYQDAVDNNCDGVVDETNDLANGDWLSWSGEVADDQVGSSFAGGLVDTDDNADILIAAPEAFSQEGFEGKVYGIKGSLDAWSEISTLGGADNFVAGANEFDRIGSSVAVGNFISGGLQEVAIGSIGYDAADGNGNGCVVLFAPLLDTSSDFGDASFTWWGDDSFSYAGRALAFVGDIDGDGGEELLVGANGENRAYLLSLNNGANRSGMLSSVAAATLQGTDEDFGWSVAGGQDLDGDGIDDYVVGANSNSSTALSAGAVYVYLGGALQAEPSVVIFGDDEYSEVGYSTAVVSDVNGDGYGELLTGAPAQGVQGEASRGAAYLLPGGSSWENRSLLDATQIQGQHENEFLGLSVAALGDVNSDGLGDFAVGGLSDENGEDGGAIYLFLGGARSYDSAQYGAHNADAIFLGGQDMLASVVAGVGNTNGKVYDDVDFVLPYDDFAIGAPGDEHQAGRAFLFFGQPSHD